MFNIKSCKGISIRIFFNMIFSVSLFVSFFFFSFKVTVYVMEVILLLNTESLIPLQRWCSCDAEHSHRHLTPKHQIVYATEDLKCWIWLYSYQLPSIISPTSQGNFWEEKILMSVKQAHVKLTTLPAFLNKWVLEVKWCLRYLQSSDLLWFQ